MNLYIESYQLNSENNEQISGKGRHGKGVVKWTMVRKYGIQFGIIYLKSYMNVWSSSAWGFRRCKGESTFTLKEPIESGG